jgi:ubiquitin-protein ligase
MDNNGQQTKKPAIPMRSRRIMGDLRELLKDPLYEVFIHFDESDINHMIVMIRGQEGPYEFCQFLFHIRFSDDYPMSPPIIKFCSSDGRTRLNPNLYIEGKVCLSILGTWQGDPWTSVMTIKTVILSIMALVMTREPLRNEPGMESSPADKIETYNQIVEYASLNILVNQIQNPSEMFAPLLKNMKAQFIKDYPAVIEKVDRLIRSENNKKIVKISYHSQMANLDYESLKKRIYDLYGIVSLESLSLE